jgi:hypothetical protein
MGQKPIDPGTGCTDRITVVHGGAEWNVDAGYLSHSEQEQP